LSGLFINEKVKKFNEPKNLALALFPQAKPVRPLAEKIVITVVKKAKGEYLSLAWKGLISP
jgi:hypothetical protein